MKFEILSEIEDLETIAVGTGIQSVSFLQKMHGPGRWRKMKGNAYIRLRNGHIRYVELHWYEAHGIGRRDIKIKHYLG